MNYKPNTRYGYSEWYVRFPWNDEDDTQRIYGQGGTQFTYYLERVMTLKFLHYYMSSIEPGKEWLFKYER